MTEAEQSFEPQSPRAEAVIPDGEESMAKLRKAGLLGKPFRRIKPDVLSFYEKFLDSLAGRTVTGAGLRIQWVLTFPKENPGIIKTIDATFDQVVDAIAPGQVAQDAKDFKIAVEEATKEKERQHALKVMRELDDDPTQNT